MRPKQCFVYCNSCNSHISHYRNDPWSRKSSHSCDNNEKDCEPECSPCPPKCKPVCPPVCPPICPPKCKSSCSMAETLVSVRDTESDIFVNSASLVDLVNWTDLIIDARESFDNRTGIYTALCSGDYEVSLVVNFRTAFPICLDVAPFNGGARVEDPDIDPLTAVPRIELYDICTNEPIVASQFPTVNLSVCIPQDGTEEPCTQANIRALLQTGQVVINTVVPLCECQRVRFRVALSGNIVNCLPFPIPIPPTTPIIDLSPPGSTTTATFKKLRDTPCVTITV